MTAIKNLFSSAVTQVLIPLFLLVTCVLVALSPLVEDLPELAWALAIDMMVTVPLVYWLLIRKRSISKITVVPWFVVGIILSYHLLNQQSQPITFWAFHYLLPLIELAVVSTITYKAVRLVKEYRAQKSTMDFIEAIHHSTQEVFGVGLPAKLLAWEIAVVYYALVKWRHQFAPNQFTYHRQAPIKSILAVIMFLVVVETVVFHLLLQIWSVVAAWILTALSIYSLLWLIAQWKTMAFRPQVVDDQKLILHHGLLYQVTIPLDRIENCEEIRKVDSAAKVLSIMPQLDSPNVQLKLYSDVTVEGIYGQSSTERVIAFKVDDPRAFCEAVNNLTA